MADQQGKELLGSRFTIEGLHRGRDLFRVIHDLFLCGLFTLRIGRRVVQYDVLNEKDVPKPEIAKGLLHFYDTGGIRILDCSRLLLTAQQSHEREDQHCYRSMYFAAYAFHWTF
jgi:hypothetical protein